MTSRTLNRRAQFIWSTSLFSVSQFKQARSHTRPKQALETLFRTSAHETKGLGPGVYTHWWDLQKSIWETAHVHVCCLNSRGPSPSSRGRFTSVINFLWLDNQFSHFSTGTILPPARNSERESQKERQRTCMAKCIKHVRWEETRRTRYHSSVRECGGKNKPARWDTALQTQLKFKPRTNQAGHPQQKRSPLPQDRCQTSHIKSLDKVRTTLSINIETCLLSSFFSFPHLQPLRTALQPNARLDADAMFRVGMGIFQQYNIWIFEVIKKIYISLFKLH